MRNPTVYVFLGDEASANVCGGLREGVKRAAARIHSAGTAFFADFAHFSDAPRGNSDVASAKNAGNNTVGDTLDNFDTLRAVKVDVLSNVAGLKLTRVNVYAVATPEHTAAILDETGGHLRNVFREDFVSVDLNLIVILDESKTNTYQFLKNLFNHTAFNRVFLLSSKNEHNEMRAGFFENICETIAALPLINTTDSRFCEILAARSFEQERVLFASAGAWMRPTSNVAENRALHRQAEAMEREIAFGESSRELSQMRGNCSAISTGGNDCDSIGEIVENIASVAAKSLRFWHLWGYTIGDAEKLLFGNGAEKFFEKNYAKYSPSPDNFKSPEAMPLSQVAAQERALRQNIDEMNGRMRRKENELAQSQAAACPKNPLLGVDYVKTVIGENYARQYAITRLRKKIAELNEHHAAMQTHLDRAREKIQELKALPIVDENEKYNFEYVTAYAENLAPIAISLLRDDGLLRENHIFADTNGEPCVLRLMGGFAIQDLSRAAAG